MPVLAMLLAASAASAADAPPAHPFLLFRTNDLPALRLRAAAEPLLADCLHELRAQAADEAGTNTEWTARLEARAFLGLLDDDAPLRRTAVSDLLATLGRRDPAGFYRKSDFHMQAAPLRAFALAWDWLQADFDATQRVAVLSGLRNWCTTAFACTEKQWWREASYNVGAVPMGGIGTLALAIAGDARDPAVDTCLREATRRLAQNYFPNTWKRSGICYEGPNYAIVGLKYSALFAQALARSGGDDLLADSGARLAARYLQHQYLPWGGCAPIGDNTSYGPRTFAAEYLLGIGATRDAAALWTWRQYARARRLDPLIAFLWYPLDLAPAGPAASRAPTSAYFEVTPSRAGYVFGRSAWEDPDAAVFAFVTRFERCNHQHYDMNSFLFGGFGTLFATHRMLYPYPSDLHGIDWEHNLVIVAGGGWPHANRTASCADDCSTEGLLVGRVLSGFADYVRGDAKFSYRDNAVWTSNPAIRAERACLFVKAGAAPWLLVLDDAQQLATPVDYDWLWHAPQLPLSGAGTAADPLVLGVTNTGASCAIHFLQPAAPAVRTEFPPLADDRGATNRPSGLVRLRVAQNEVRARYAAIATLQRHDADRPKVAPLAVACMTPGAGGARLDHADGARDLVVWQSEEGRVQRGEPLVASSRGEPLAASSRGEPLAAGDLATDGLVALVRLRGDQVTGFLLGEGTYLRWRGATLVQADSSCSAAAGNGDSQIEGRLRSREGLPDAPAVNPRVAPLP